MYSVKNLFLKYHTVLAYGISLSLLLFLLKWFQWKFFILDNSMDIYIGLIGIFFTLLGFWIARQFVRTVVVEKEVIVPVSEKFVLNEKALEALHLTPREWDVLQLMAEGKSNAEIAESLFLSLSTIKTHTSNVLSKMDVKNRIQAIEKAKRLNIIPYTQMVL